MKVVDLENIKIVSVNQKYGVNPKTGIIYTDKKYKAFKLLVKSHCLRQFIEPPYSVTIEIDTYVDITNFEKCVIDGIQDAGIIDNDKNILKLTVFKNPIPKNKLGNISVTVEHYMREF